MCQLPGMHCNNTAAIHFSVTGFAECGGRTADHVDGWGIGCWGIGFHERSGCCVLHDDPTACTSLLSKFICD